MKTQSFAKQFKANLYFYFLAINNLNKYRKQYRILKNLRDSILEYRQSVTYPGYLLLDPSLRFLIENEELISQINWELQGLEIGIEGQERNIRWHKTRPIWIPLG